MQIARWEPSRHVVVTALLVAVLGGLALAVPFGATGARVIESLSNVATVASIGCCAAAALATLGRTRLTWALFAGMQVSWLVGDLCWWMADSTTASTGFGTVAELSYLIGLLPACAALVVLPVGRWETGALARTILDTVVVSTALLAVLDVLVLGSVLDGLSDWTEIATLSYPVADVVLASLALALSRRRVGRPRADLLLLAAAFGSWMVADTGYAWVTATGGDYFATPFPAAFLLAPVLMAVAATCARHDAHLIGDGQLPRHATPGGLVALPDLLIMSAGVVCILAGADQWHEWALIGLGAVSAVARTSLTELDAHQLRADLADRVRARTRDLESLTDRHRRVLGSVDDGIVGVDADRRITFINDAAATLLGLDTAAAVGADACARLHGPRCLSCLLDAAILRGDTVTQAEQVYQHSSGRGVPVEVTISPMTDDRGESGVVVCFRDLTQRRAVEQLKHQFVSSVSHELRTPLSAIRGSLEMLADGDGGELPPTAMALVRSAERGSERLSRLVDDVIDHERLVTGAFEVSPQSVAAATLLEETAESMAALAVEAGVRLVVGHTDGTALADPHRIAQALVNLVGNAVKFTPPGGSVTLTARRDGPAVVVSITDTGRGIPADQLHRVFDRFHQVVVSDGHDRGGAGLGLAITKSIVERHGGRIWAESTLGEGSAFCFTLPAVTGSGAGGTTRADTPQTDIPSQPTGREP